MHKLIALSVGIVLAARTAGAPAPPAPAGPLVMAGFSKVDITPEGPIRLAGYNGRTTEATQVLHPIYARALALGGDGPAAETGAAPSNPPAVLITVELLGISADLTEALSADLRAKHGIDRAHLAVCATHTHTAPMMDYLVPSMFSSAIPADQTERIHRYTQALLGKLELAAEQALAARRPSRLAWSRGTVAFAAYRRKIAQGKWAGWTSDLDGPSDKSLPVLRVSRPDGDLRGVFVSYGCHNTTFGTEDNFVDGDWAGDASRRIEHAHDGAVALIGLGCAGDQNPAPNGRHDYVAKHGQEVAAEVQRLLDLPGKPLGRVTAAGFYRTSLPFDRQVTREDLEARVSALAGNKTADAKAVRWTAQQWIERLAQGEPAPASAPFAIQHWRFGRDLTMVFFTGEMVSEYSLRLERELDSTRLWINAYSNDVHYYVPSRRMFSEGGYEVARSMDLYGWPTSFSPEIEELIIADVRRILGPESAR